MASFRNLWRFEGDNCANVLITKLPQIEIQTMAKRILNYVQYQQMIKKDKKRISMNFVHLMFHYLTTSTQLKV